MTPDPTVPGTGGPTTGAVDCHAGLRKLPLPGEPAASDRPLAAALSPLSGLCVVGTGQGGRWFNPSQLPNPETRTCSARSWPAASTTSSAAASIAGTWNGGRISRAFAASWRSARRRSGHCGRGPGPRATSRNCRWTSCPTGSCTSLHGLLNRRIRLDREVRGEVRSAYRRLDGVSRVRLKRNTFGQFQLGGQRRVYHHLLSVCRLLYRSSVVDEKTGRTAFRDFRRDKATM